MKISRLSNNPIIYPYMDGRMGANINGPSMIRVPRWISKPLGRYYLYFAHHKGDYIRLAYADNVEGPWITYESGTLSLEESFANDHIASPDIHVDNAKQQIYMYFHGAELDGTQKTRVAVSNNGISFEVSPEILGPPYFRVFRFEPYYYALARSGILYRSLDGLSKFEKGPSHFSERMRHSAIYLDGDFLSVFYTRIGDAPERILVSTCKVLSDWTMWRPSKGITILEPEMEYEGADLAVEPSVRGAIMRRVRQLRDPAIFNEEGRVYLIYSVSGEHGIAIAELEW